MALYVACRIAARAAQFFAVAFISAKKFFDFRRRERGDLGSTGRHVTVGSSDRSDCTGDTSVASVGREQYCFLVEVVFFIQLYS